MFGNKRSLCLFRGKNIGEHSLGKNRLSYFETMWYAVWLSYSQSHYDIIIKHVQHVLFLNDWSIFYLISYILCELVETLVSLLLNCESVTVCLDYDLF